jgi:hypothetical protein
MMIMLRAALAVVSLASIGSAYGADRDIRAALNPPAGVAQAYPRNPATIAPTPNEATVAARPDRGPWLFPPIGKYIAG